MKGDDGYGNSFEMEKHFEVGKAYIWNTKIPHEVTFMEKTSDMTPRIHMVIGFLPWLNYNKDMDCFWHSDNYGKQMKDIRKILKNGLSPVCAHCCANRITKVSPFV